MVDFEDVDFPWPRKGDKLFTSEDDWWHNACLNTVRGDWYPYISGYKKAADILAAYITDKSQEQDFLVYPIVFLYRQYLELRIKKLIIDGYRLQDKNLDFPKIHDLTNLWNECKRVIKELSNEADEHLKDLPSIDEAIKEFSNWDPTSENFRYPENKSGQPSLHPDLNLLNLRNFGEVMEKISNFLEAGAMQFSVYLEYKNEMELDFKD